MISVRLVSSSCSLQLQLVGDRQAEQVGDRRAVERREQRDRHVGAELRRIGHVGEHLHHADQRADHAEGRRAVADRAIDFLALVEMDQEVVAVALEVVADEAGVVAVGDEAHALWPGTDPRCPPFRARSGPACARPRPAARSRRPVRASVQRRMVKANFMPIGRPWKMQDSGKRISVAAVAPPKMTMKACRSRNIRRSPPIMIRVTSTMPPNASPRPVEISMKHSNAQTGRDPVRRQRT